MKNLKFLYVLRPVEKSAHIGRGEYIKFTHGFREEPVAVDADAFLCANLDTVTTAQELRGTSVSHSVVWVEFAKGDRLACYHITLSEFKRFFGMPWPVEKTGSSDNQVIP